MARGALITGIPGEMARIRKYVQQLEMEAVQEVQLAAIDALSTAMVNTPVWTGTTVRNYRWGRDGQMPSGEIRNLTGEKGTNQMPLGPEKHRAAAESAAMRALLSILDKRKLRDYTMTNTVRAEQWDMVDNGTVPGPSPPYNHRSPGGLGKLAAQRVRARKHWK